MSYTQQQLDALTDAIAQGVRSVKVDGKEVTYASTAEMLRLKAAMERALTPAANRATHFTATYSKGL